MNENHMDDRPLLATEKQYCANNQPGEQWLARQERDGRLLHLCLDCGRVLRAQRKHQEPGRNTASHDKTMSILFAHAEIPIGKRIEDEFEIKLKEYTRARDWTRVALLCGWYETFLVLFPEHIQEAVNG